MQAPTELSHRTGHSHQWMQLCSAKDHCNPGSMISFSQWSNYMVWNYQVLHHRGNGIVSGVPRPLARLGWYYYYVQYCTAEPAFRIPVPFLGIRMLEQLILAYSIESVTVTIFAGISSTLYSVLCSRSTNLQPYAWRRGIPERSPMSPFQFPLPVPVPVPTPTAQVLQYNTQGWCRIAVIIHCTVLRLQGCKAVGSLAPPRLANIIHIHHHGPPAIR